MILRCLPLAAALLLALPGSAHGQSVPEHAAGVLETVWTDLRHGFGDIWHVWTSPFHASASDWAGAGMTVAAAGAATPLDDNFDGWLATHGHTAVVRAFDPVREASVQDFGREGGFEVGLADIGSGHKATRFSGILYLGGLVIGSQELRDAAVGCAASIQGNALPRAILYDLVGRARPAVAEGDQYRFTIPGDGDSWDDNSFFGGHGANAMACATFWNQRFDLGYAEPLLWALGVGVGVGRVLDRHHWISDAIVGTVFGYAAGRTVAARSLRRAAARDAGDPSGDDDHGLLPGKPHVSRAADGLRLGWTLRF
ncbi:MAG: phosphatase PAP2 family protein [Gemmatimonadota bacterium]